jgi:Ser/Thr protein kinase RdoA (MazF antagonist)
MMKLSTLWNVDRLLDAAGRNPIADQILASWDHDPGSARFRRSSTNFVYVFSIKGAKQFLRFAASSERTREAIAAEVDLVNWLARAGLSVARPIQSRTGGFVQTTATELGTFHAVAFAGLPGSRFDIADLTGAQFGEWGAALGKLHSAVKGYPGLGSATRRTWSDDLQLARTFFPPGERAAWRGLDHIASALELLPVNRDTFGLIHFDFELDNLRWHDLTVGMFDFDDCSHYWYVADIAFALRDLFPKAVDLTNRSFRDFVRGYSAHCPLDAELLARVPLFLRLANLIQYARLVRGLDLPGGQEYPQWLEALRRKLERRLETYRASL